MSQFDKPPYLASPPNPQTPFSQPPRNRSAWPVLLVGLPLLGLFCCCTPAFIYWLIPSGNSGTQGPQETTEAKLQRVRTAFHSDEDPRQHAEYQALERLFARLLNDFAAGSNNLGDNVDYKLHYLAMVASGHMQPAPFATRAFFIKSLSGNVVAITRFDKFKIAHIDDLGNGKEALVYVYVSAADGSTGEYCFWCVNDKGRWKIYDWERLDHGIRASHELAIINADTSAYRYQEYVTTYDNLTEVAEANPWEDSAEIERKIRDAEGKQKIAGLENQMWLLIAYAWNGQGEWRESLRCLAQISDPSSAPGAEMARAWCYFGLKQYDEAIEHANQYEALIGRCPDVFDLRALCYQELGRPDLVAKNYRGWLEIFPDNQDALIGLARVLNRDHLDELQERIKSTAAPLDIAQQLAPQFANSHYFAGVDAMLEIAKETGSESATVAFLEGLQAELAGNDELALQHYQRAISKAAGPEDMQIYKYRLMDHFASLNRPLDVYNALADKQDTFETLVYYYEDGDYSFSADQFQKLLAAHRKIAPQDPIVLSYAADELVTQKKYEEAIELLRSALTKMAAEDSYGLKYTLMRAYVAAGREQDALMAIDPAADTFERLASILSGNKDDVRLQALVDAYRKLHADDQSILRWESELLERQGRTLEAIKKLQAIGKDANEEWRHSLDQQKILELATVLTIPQAAVAKDALTDQELVLRKIDAFIAGDDLEAARKLVALAVSYGGSDFRLQPLAEAKILAAEHQFAKAAAIMTDQWMARIAVEEPASKLTALRLLTSSARESGDLPRAERFAQMLADENDENSELAKIACLQKNPLRLAELLNENDVWVVSHPASVRDAYSQPIFNSVRKQHPWDWPYSAFTYSDTLFFASAQNYQTDELKKRITNAFDGKVTLDEDSAAAYSSAERVFSFTAGTLLFKVSVGTKKLWHDTNYELPKEAEDVLRTCQSWICLESISSESFAYGDEPADQADLRKTVLRALDSEQVTGVAFDNRILPIEIARKTLLQQNPSGSWEADGKILADAGYFWFDRDSSPRPKFDRAKTEGLWKAGQAFHSGAAKQKLELKLLLAGDAYDRELWTTVYVAKPANYGTYDFRVILNEDVDILRHQGWPVGEPFSVSLSNIVDWRTE